MAGTIEKRGEKSYRLTVTAGYEGTGKKRKQVRHRKTVIAESDLAAEKLLAAFIVEVERGQLATSGKMTLKEFFTYWEENYATDRHAPKTISYNKGLFKRIESALGHKRLDKITPKNLLDFYKNLKEPIKIVRKKQVDPDNPLAPERLSPNTIRKYHVLLHTLLAKAVQWQLIGYNPAEHVAPPRGETKRKAIYDEETTGKFLLCLENEELKYQVWVLLSMAAGPRRGEVFGLQWKHVNELNNTVNIEQASQYLPENGIFIKAPKNRSSIRVISVPGSVMHLLSSYKAEQLTRRNKLKLVKDGGKWEGPADMEEEFLFTKWNGLPAHPDSINTWLKDFIERNDLPHITPHAFRHMAATYLITAGTDIRTVAGKLGHSSSTTTQIVYSHLLKSAEKETAVQMESILQSITDKAKEKQKKEQEKKQVNK